MNDDATGPRVGIVVATPSEAGGILDALRETQTLRSGRTPFHSGQFADSAGRPHHVVVVIGGVGLLAAVEATQLLVETFRPSRLLVAGFAGGLRPLDGNVYSVNRVLAVKEIANFHSGYSGDATPCLLELESSPTFPSATLLTAPRVVRTPEEKRSLAAEYHADLVDMETWGVVMWCQKRGVPVAALRILFDTANEEISEETVRLMNAAQKSTARLVGSLARMLVTQPTVVPKLYHLKERAIVAADALARATQAWLAETVVVEGGRDE